jgi:hypothetical protein
MQWIVYRLVLWQRKRLWYVYIGGFRCFWGPRRVHVRVCRAFTKLEHDVTVTNLKAVSLINNTGECSNLALFS